MFFWVVALVGVIFLVISRGHYTLDVILSYFICTRVFWNYHTMVAHPTMRVSFLSRVFKRVRKAVDPGHTTFIYLLLYLYRIYSIATSYFSNFIQLSCISVQFVPFDFSLRGNTGIVGAEILEGTYVADYMYTIFRWN